MDFDKLLKASNTFNGLLSRVYCIRHENNKELDDLKLYIKNNELLTTMHLEDTIKDYEKAIGEFVDNMSMLINVEMTNL